KMWSLIQNLQIPLLWATAAFGTLSVICGLLSGIVGYQLSKDADKQIALAHSEAANANSAAAEAGERAAALEKEAAALRAQAEADRLARIKIEEKLAPRRVKQRDQEFIAAQISEFKGQLASIGSSPPDIESERLEMAIYAALTTGG